MSTILLYLSFFALFFAFACAKGPQTRIGVTFRPDVCEKKTQKGDKISLHYNGYLLGEKNPVSFQCFELKDSPLVVVLPK
jgi:hypothetical protein